MEQRTTREDLEGKMNPILPFSDPEALRQVKAIRCEQLRESMSYSDLPPGTSPTHYL
ncbi:MAG: hypothetical protein WCP89_00650 [archaeon]